MTTQNAIKIGKGIGKIMKLDNNNSTWLICRKFIRFKIEINTSLPLALGFKMPCAGADPYGLIGHKKGVCPALQQLNPSDKYDKPLRASSYVSPCLVSKVQQEDSNSTISSAALVGNSLSSVVPS